MGWLERMDLRNQRWAETPTLFSSSPWYRPYAVALCVLGVIVAVAGGLFGSSRQLLVGLLLLSAGVIKLVWLRLAGNVDGGDSEPDR